MLFLPEFFCLGCAGSYSFNNHCPTTQVRLQAAVSEGCVMLFLPECFAFIGSSQQESLAQSQPLNGPLMRQYCDMARCAKGLGLHEVVH